MTSNLVLDASAVLAVIFRERGADAVIPRLSGALLSTVNLAEVVGRGVEKGRRLEDCIRETERLPIRIVHYDAEQAHVSASLRPATKPLGLSLADRACLALGLLNRATVLTSDRKWCELDLGIKVEAFR